MGEIISAKFFIKTINLLYHHVKEDLISYGKVKLSSKTNDLVGIFIPNSGEY